MLGAAQYANAQTTGPYYPARDYTPGTEYFYRVLGYTYEKAHFWTVYGGAGFGSFNKYHGVVYDASVAFNVKLGPIDFYPEIGFSSRGGKERYLYTQYNQYANDKTATYIRRAYGHNVKLRPLQFKSGLLLIPLKNTKLELRINPHIGSFVSFDYLQSTLQTKEDDAWATYDGPDPEYEVDLNRFDAGINAGIEICINKFVMDFMYEQGFVNMIKGERSWSGSFIMRAGWTF